MHRAHSIFYSFLSANDDDDGDDHGNDDDHDDDHGNYDDIYIL